MDTSSEGLPGAVAETLEDHVDDALEHATDDDALFHLRHAKQLLVHLDADAAEGAAGEQCRSDAD